MLSENALSGTAGRAAQTLLRLGATRQENLGLRRHRQSLPKRVGGQAGGSPRQGGPCPRPHITRVTSAPELQFTAQRTGQQLAPHVPRPQSRRASGGETRPLQLYHTNSHFWESGGFSCPS